MSITSAVYTEEGSIQAVIDSITMTVPDNMANRHRVAIAEWEGEGNTITPYVVPEPTSDQLISELEAQVTSRNLRGAALGDQYAIDHIQSIEDQITALRG